MTNTFKQKLMYSSAADIGSSKASVIPKLRTSQTRYDLRLSLSPPKLKVGERGLVISPPLEFHNDGSFSCGGCINADLMRFYLLFWDRFDWPINRLISIGAPDDNMKFLIESGIVFRSQITGSMKGDGTRFLIEAHKATYTALAKRDANLWSLAKGADSISFKESELEADRGLLFRLHQAIPVPTRDVPFQEILEFKAIRHPELLALRHHLTETYANILSAPDRAISTATEFEKLDLAIADCIKVLTEKNFPLRLTGVTANLNLPEAILAAGTAMTSAQAGLPLTASLLNGAAAATTIKLGAGLRGAHTSDTPYQYVTSLYKSIGLPTPPPNKSAIPWF